MAEQNRKVLRSLGAINAPSWSLRSAFRKLVTRIDPELYSQGQQITMSRYGVVKAVGGKFGEFEGSGNQFAIDRPSGGAVIDPAKALGNNRGFVYAAVNAIAREVMTIDWRLFEVNGEDEKEHREHAVLDLLDTVNDSMISLSFKYLMSACLTLTGNCYIFLEGVTSDLDKPKAIHLMPPDRVRPVIDRRSWPYQIKGYKMKLENREYDFEPYEVIHLQLPNPSDFFEGMSPVQAGAEYIDNDNYAQEFNRKFFRNGARPAGFLETDMIAETQIEVLKIGFANMHQGIDNMNGIAVLPKGVKWAPNGASPKDMDFKNLSEDSKERTLAMFGVSRTILGTAESDTNRATAETADYVFSKRVVKPHMLLICAFLNEKLLPRFGDNIYLSFIDPVPEDRAARTTEMTTAVGGQPILTVDEAREEFMGLGPVEGGDRLMKPTAMAPADAPDPVTDTNGKPKKPPVTNENDESQEEQGKAFGKKVHKTMNGERVAYRPLRTKLASRAKARTEMGTSLAKKIAEDLKKLLEIDTKKFGSTPERDAAVFKDFAEYTEAAEKEIAENIRAVNAEQQKTVIANLPKAIDKAVDPTKLFDLDNWISITIDAVTPAMETLYEHQGKEAAAEVGKPDLNPFTAATKAALHESIEKMSRSYQNTVLQEIEKVVNDGLASGQSLGDMSRAIGDRYTDLDGYAAERIAKTESFRTSNAALKDAWRQSGVVKTIRWYTTDNPCPFCQTMNGKVISIDSNFVDSGETVTVGEGGDAKTMTADYGDVGAPPLHPNCKCLARPEDVSL